MKRRTRRNPSDLTTIALIAAGIAAVATIAKHQQASATDTRPGVQAAIRDLSQRLGIPASTITVVMHDPMQFTSSALGCPQPGQMYALALTRGYRIILCAGGETENNCHTLNKLHEYHASIDGSRVVYCGQKSPGQ